MHTRHAVIQDIILHEVITKRQKLLDQIAEGLNSLGLLTLIQAFPAVFESMFVYIRDIRVDDVKAILEEPVDMTPDELTAWTKFLDDCSQEGM